MSFIITEAAGLYGPQLKKTEEFLQKMGLRYEGGADHTVFLTDEDGELLGTGSLCGSVLKYIAVDDALQGEGGAAAIVSRLVQRAYLTGRRKLFLFTKPQNEYLFRSLGFFPLASTRSTMFMENSRRGLKNYLDSLEKGSGVQGAVVANCNPFTLGHQYLMETAASMVDTLHVFVVSEDSSLFPFKTRFELVRRGTEHIKNLILHESGDYIISRSTFPTYFIKNEADAERVNTELDLALFGERIAPALGITKRFVGTEPFCPVTNKYNEAMKEVLPKYGVEVIELERRDAISASRVRAAMEARDLETVRKLVPDATYECVKALLEKRAENE
ncbi:MAG: [Clostridia bacterium]|nr:[citrate (pro-3S)-lyase] ligase [Clostridia bacterium]